MIYIAVLVVFCIFIGHLYGMYCCEGPAGYTCSILMCVFFGLLCYSVIGYIIDGEICSWKL